MTTYKEAGVDIDEATKALRLIKEPVKSTHNRNVLGEGLFGGLLDVSFLKNYEHPILVQSVDSVGTKMMIAEMVRDFGTIGEDIVNHCVNDILCQGAKPISFLDYISSEKLKAEEIREIVEGMASACNDLRKDVRILPITGGEMAELPPVYQKDRHDVIGFVTGVVEKKRLINGSKIKEGDILIGLPSNGLHTNGFSLARKVLLEIYEIEDYVPDLGLTMEEELLRIHRCYFNSVYSVLESDFFPQVSGIAHITGGGLPDNISRLLEDKLQAEVVIKKDRIPPVFGLIQELGRVSDEEMRKVFNLGIGIILIVDPHEERIKKILRDNDEEVIDMGVIKKRKEGEEKVVFIYE